MFKVKLKKSNEEIQCINKKISYSKNIADVLTFELGIGSIYYNKFKKYLNYIQVVNEANNALIFDGRVLSNQVSMNSEGEFLNIITCESAINYFNDTYVGQWEFHPLEVPDKAPKGSIPNATVKMFLSKVLDNHNSIVESEKQILLGNIEINDRVYIKTSYESSLGAIMTKVIDRHDGYLIIRNENGINYLDFLVESPIKDTQNIEIGVNMDSIQIDDSNTDIFTRIIPLGKNNIDITSVNKGYNYIQSDELVKKYGTIEKIMQWADITIPQNLLNKANAIFSKIKLDADNIKLTALDLSYIDNDFKSLKMYRPIRAINKVINYDNTHEIVSINLDLDYPFKSTFDLNTTVKTANDNVASAIQQNNSNKIEIVSIGNELETKVSNDNFESYKTQSANEIKDTVSSINKDISSVRDQTSSQIKDTVTNLTEEIASSRTQTANEIKDTVSSINKDISSVRDQTSSQIKDTVANLTEEIASSRTQTASEIKDTVKDMKNNIEATREILAGEIEDKVSSKDFDSYKVQTDKSIKQSVTDSKNYADSSITETATNITSELNNKIITINDNANKNQKDTTEKIESLSSKINQSARSLTSTFTDSINTVNNTITNNKNNVDAAIGYNTDLINNNKNAITTQSEILSSKIVQSARSLSTSFSDTITTNDNSTNKKITDLNSKINQTANSISSVVTSTNNSINSLNNGVYKNIQTLNENIATNSSRITQTDNSIKLKVTKDDVSSQLTEKMNEFDFTIGTNTPLTIKENQLEMNFTNGAKCEISQDGFYYVTPDSKHAYHSLYEHGSVTKVPGGVTSRIHVPEVFRGTNYKIAYWLGNVFAGNPYQFLNSYGVELVEDNRQELYFDIKVLLQMRVYNTPLTESMTQGWGNIVYTILA